MSDALTFLLGFLGFAALSLGLRRHQQELLGRALARRATWAVRSAGYAAIAGAAVVALAAHGFGYGMMVWAGLLSLAAALTVLALAFRPRGRADRARSRP